MKINQTLNYLLANQSKIILPFSGDVTTSTVFLKGAGGSDGDGYPMPMGGYIEGLICWDGSNNSGVTQQLAFNQGDRIAVKAVETSGTFNVTLVVNDVETSIFTLGSNGNTTLYVSVLITLMNDVLP